MAESDRITRLERQVELLTRQIAGLPVRLGETTPKLQRPQLAMIVEVFCPVPDEDRYVAGDPPFELEFQLGSVPVKLALLDLDTLPVGIANPTEASSIGDLTFYAYDVRRDGVPTVGEVVKVWTSDGRPAVAGENQFDELDPCDTVILGSSHEIYCDTVNATDYLRGLPTWDQPTQQFLYHQADSYLLEWVAVEPGGGEGGDTIVAGCGINTSGVGTVTVSFDNVEVAGFGLAPAGSCGLDVFVDGCTIVFDDDDAISVSLTNIAGNGLGTDLTEDKCQLVVNVDEVMGIVIEDDEVQLYDKDYNNAVHQQYISFGASDFRWVDAYTVKCTKNDTTANFLHDALTFAAPASTYVLTRDAAVYNETGTPAGDENEILFMASDKISGYDDEGAFVLSLTDDMLKWITPTEAGTVTGGCGITVEEGLITVDPVALAGKGLDVESDCKIQVLHDNCTLMFDGSDALAVNLTNLAGPGLTADLGEVNCLLEVAPGYGIEVTEANDNVGLYQTGSAAGDQFYVCSNQSTFSWVTAYQVKVNSSDSNATYLHDAFTDNVSATYVSGKDIRIYNQTTAGNLSEQLFLDVDLIPGYSATLAYVLTLSGGSPIWAPQSGGGSLTGGCGIAITSSVVDVVASEIAGLGLQEVGGSSCEIDVAIDGCTIAFNEFDQIKVDLPAIAGPGLTVDEGEGNCLLEVNPGLGINILSDAVALYNTDYAAGTTQLYGHTPTATFRHFNIGCGLEVSGNTLQVKTSDLNSGGACALSFSGGGGDTVAAGCGITITGSSPKTISTNITALAGAGLGTNTSGGACELKVNVGCGLQLDSGGDTIVVKPGDLTGDGLEAAGGNQTDNDGPCKIQAKLGCGLAFSTDGTPKSIVLDIANIIGDGLGEQTGNQDDANGPCKIKVATNITVPVVTSIELNLVGSTLQVKLNYTPYSMYGVVAGAASFFSDVVDTTTCEA
jgi:hypothetical protein